MHASVLVVYILFACACGFVNARPPLVILAESSGDIDGDTESHPILEAVTSHPHSIRLCHIKSWKDGKGYGFNMLAQKGRSGHYIGHIEEGLPGQLGGLREGDRIIEVNGVSVESISHKEVVTKIKADPDKTVLLVVDQDADKYFTEKGIMLSSAVDFLERFSTPEGN